MCVLSLEHAAQRNLSNTRTITVVGRVCAWPACVPARQPVCTRRAMCSRRKRRSTARENWEYEEGWPRKRGNRASHLTQWPSLDCARFYRFPLMPLPSSFGFSGSFLLSIVVVVVVACILRDPPKNLERFRLSFSVDHLTHSTNPLSLRSTCLNILSKGDSEWSLGNKVDFFSGTWPALLILHLRRKTKRKTILLHGIETRVSMEWLLRWQIFKRIREVEDFHGRF